MVFGDERRGANSSCILALIQLKMDSAKYNGRAQGLLVGRGAPLHNGRPGPRGTCASMTPSRALDLVMAASTAGPAPRTPLLLPTPLDAITAEQASARDTSSLCTHEYAHGAC